MIKSVATGLIITYVMILFGYGVATAGHELLHDIKNPFHTHGQVHEHDHGYEEEKEGNDHHEHDAIQQKDDHHADNNHDNNDHIENMASKSHEIEDHTNGFDKLKGQAQDVSPTETLSPLFIFVYSQSNSLIKSTRSNFKLSETEHHYLSLYKSPGSEPVTPPPPSLS